MKGTLTINQREYILFHLNHILELSSGIRERFVFGEKKEDSICFSQNPNAFDEKNIKQIGMCPVLFPVGEEEVFFTFNKGTLVFHHDLLKSAFYLLSGYQEYASTSKDILGRYPYEASLQHRMEIIDRPVVNEYFDILVEGIEVFCHYHKIPIQRKSIFGKGAAYLTHDVDRIDKYTFHTVKGCFKKSQFKKGFRWLFHWLNPVNHGNPYWSYPYLSQTENKLGLTSAYFFLNSRVKHQDSYYQFDDVRIKRLIQTLEEEGKEIALHAGVMSSNDPNVIKADLEALKKVSRQPIWGNRQHRLLLRLPDTIKHLESAGVRFDSSLGFAPHEGFRNSYCLPFKLFDFENDRIMDVWEIPLIVMDKTLFGYRKLTYDDAFNSIRELIGRIKRHGGVVTLLFHPDFLDEEEKPGIRNFYERVLNMIMNEEFKYMNGKEIITLLGDIDES